MRTTHTPGPWTNQGNIIKGTERGQFVAKLYTRRTDEQVGMYEEKANASLISAAPQLLYILKEIVAWAQESDFTAFDEAKKIINKAEGRA